MANKNIELPKLRYVDDAARVLHSIQAELKDTQQLVNLQFKKLSNTAIKANVSTLDNLYLLSEAIHDNVRSLAAMSTQLSMQFSDQVTTNPYARVAAKLNELKIKANTELNLVLAFLESTAKSSIAKSLSKQAKSVFDLVKQTLNIKDCKINVYLSNNADKVMFNYYLTVNNLSNNLGDIVPSLYISLHYVPELNVCYTNFNHEFELPNKIALTNPIDYSSTENIVNSIYELFNNENFSNNLNIESLNVLHSTFASYISYSEVIKSVTVTSNALIFNLISPASEFKQTVHSIYKEVKTLVKNTGYTLLASTNLNKVSFTFQKTDNLSLLPINSYDLEFMRSKFNLSDSKIQKITNLFI
jgi:hypothetical protein